MIPKPAFWDSSALTTLCITQPASAFFKPRADQFEIVVWWAAHTEVHGAIARLHRATELNDADRRFALDRLAFLQQGWDQIEPSDIIRNQAARVLDTYPLRADDSLQLAAALAWCRNRPTGRAFLCADTLLCDAAAQAGFTVLHP